MWLWKTGHLVLGGGELIVDVSRTLKMVASVVMCTIWSATPPHHSTSIISPSYHGQGAQWYLHTIPRCRPVDDVWHGLNSLPREPLVSKSYWWLSRLNKDSRGLVKHCLQVYYDVTVNDDQYYCTMHGWNQKLMFVWLGFKISYFQISGWCWRGCDGSEMEDAESRHREDDVWWHSGLRWGLTILTSMFHVNIHNIRRRCLLAPSPCCLL